MRKPVLKVAGVAVAIGKRVRVLAATRGRGQGGWPGGVPEHERSEGERVTRSNFRVLPFNVNGYRLYSWLRQESNATFE